MRGRVELDLDFIEELRLRRWARENYVPRGRREKSWHPVVLDEMDQKDSESHADEAVFTTSA